MDRVVKITNKLYRYYVNHELQWEIDIEKEIHAATSFFIETKSMAGKAKAILRFSEIDYFVAREKIESCENPKKLLKKIRGRKYYSHYKLDIDHYTPHWLFAHRNASFMTDELYKYISDNWYDPKQSEYLADYTFIYDLDYDC